MPKQSGRLAGPTKWLVTRYPQSPGSLIVLGRILTDPENPESALNRHSGTVPVPESDRVDYSPAVRYSIRSELANNSSALLKAVSPQSPLFGAGLAVEGGTSDTVSTTVEALNVRAEVFIPTEEYMNEALKNPDVVKFAKEGLFGRPLYIIVGVASATQLDLSEEKSRATKLSASANLSVAGSAGEIAAGASVAPEASSGIEAEITQECDFAYRVREFVYSKFSRKWRDRGDITKRSMFGKDNVDGSEWEQDEVVEPKFDYCEDEDVAPSQLDGFALMVET
ncbi:hypothetical protein F4821DRAFT_211005 [Hypoxylon rubiginosum]|uniref:Uncharacterized protein n=1 Tax=Hypoxylon rubiginosum TaxID=110542 RepID=A0ACC0DE90_9PEZI|nr:hypothetical protein F4821DRAFT_211005 [Hypoxylon rubiginosum]